MTKQDLIELDDDAQFIDLGEASEVTEGSGSNDFEDTGNRSD